MSKTQHTSDGIEQSSSSAVETDDETALVSSLIEHLGLQTIPRSTREAALLIQTWTATQAGCELTQEPADDHEVQLVTETAERTMRVEGVSA
ncbi:hypothetical protein [Halosegnis longus]|uniref:hypothetical protein n=1 Tax=Halosegnis longus TaxID=2216012 RepID=UPI00129DF406|nr:hypothetical protein [Halosegnis longus]